MPIPFDIIDVFSTRPFAGNPVAVVFAPDEDAMAMQAMAAWTGMPETVFVTRPSQSRADYGVRIFSPLRELAFAGHPSIGTCHILMERGLVEPRNGIITQECPAGLFDLNVTGDGEEQSIAFRVPVEAVLPLSTSQTTSVGQALGARADQAFVVEAGARWIVVPFDDPATLDAMIPDQAAVRALSEVTGTFGITVYGPSPDADADIEVRSFGPLIGVEEDAVCGSGNACVGAARAHDDRSRGRLAFTVSQGRHRGRHGRVRVSASASDGFVSVGGAAVTSASGSLNREGDGSALVMPPVGPLRRAAR